MKEALALSKACSVKFEIGENCFTVAFYRQQINDVTDKMAKKFIQGLQVLQDNPNISTKELALWLQFSKRNILRDIEKLKHDKIRRIGNERDWYWELIGQERINE